nr:putative late blight resistance protein homolog R1B-16 [Ipomoea batatas]
MAYAAVTSMLNTLDQFLNYSPDLFLKEIKSLHKRIDAAYRAEDIVDSKVREFHQATTGEEQNKACEDLCRMLQVVIKEMESTQFQDDDVLKKKKKISNDGINNHNSSVPISNGLSIPDLEATNIHLEIAPQDIVTQRRVSSHCQNISIKPSSDHVVSLSRSFLAFKVSGGSFLPSMNFKLLRVLDIMSLHHISFPDEIVHLINLRYLALTPSDTEIPASISNLWSLQCLVLCFVSDGPTLPPEIWKLQQLRHLHVNTWVSFPHPASKSSPLPNLQTLSKLSLSSCTKDVFSSTSNLKKLGISEIVDSLSSPTQSLWPETFQSSASQSFYEIESIWPETFQSSATENCYQTESLWSECFNNFVHLRQLERLKLVCSSQLFTGEPPLVHHLDAFPTTLKKLSLSFSRLPWEYFKLLGELPNLEVLKLTSYAFTGPKWELVDGHEFRQLRFLLLGLTDLVHWETNSYLFPKLEHLALKQCYALSSIPDAIGEILTLKKLELHECCPEAVSCAIEIRQDQIDIIGKDDLDVIIVDREYQITLLQSTENYATAVQNYVK